jgi:hypothetical protein
MDASLASNGFFSVTQWISRREQNCLSARSCLFSYFRRETIWGQEMGIFAGSAPRQKPAVHGGRWKWALFLESSKRWID